MDTPVTIIGAGIVGICCALSLQERGIPVRILDRGEPGQETSFGNAGVISPWSIIPQAVPGIWKKIPGMLLDPDGPLSVHPTFWPRLIPWGLRFLGQSSEKSLRANADAMEILCAPSIDLFRRHLSGTGSEDLISDSYYVHAFRHAGKASLDAIDYRIRQEKGGQLDLIGAAELQKLEPALSRDFKAAILIRGQARARSPGQIGRVLAQKAKDNGAEFHRTELTALRRGRSGIWNLMTNTQDFEAQKVILAAGIWSADVLKPLGLKLPLVAERGYHVQFPNSGLVLHNSVMDVDAKIVASSMLEGLRVAGSSELSHPDAPPDPRKQALLTKQARALCPDLDTTDASFWMGRRPSFPDSLPVLGPIDGQDGLFGAFGHSHYGLMMAPKTGEILADLVLRKPLNINLTPFSGSRF